MTYYRTELKLSMISGNNIEERVYIENVRDCIYEIIDEYISSLISQHISGRAYE